MGAVDSGLGLAGVKTYSAVAATPRSSSSSSTREDGRCVGVIEANVLGQLRTGAASGVAAKYLARQGATRLGILGCGFQAETQVACIRAAVPTIEHVVAYCRTESNLEDFCARVGAEPAETHREAVRRQRHRRHRDHVEGSRPARRVAAGRRARLRVGANHPSRRELDDVVLERATFVCCDSREQARLESGDLIEPVANGVLDWLEVYELQDVVAGEVPGGRRDDDVVVFKSNGLAAWDVAIGAAALERARERGVGTEL